MLKTENKDHMNLTKLSLNGLWDFFYSPLKFDPASPLPEVKEYTGKMMVPGYWDDHYELFDEEDFFGRTARFNPDYRKPHFPMGRSLTPHASSSFLIGTGYCRKVFILDFDADDQIILTVGPAMWGCSVLCNGRLAGTATGYSTATDFDLTGLLKPGIENELIIAVCNVHDDGGAYHRVDGSHDGIPFGARPGQHRGLAAQGYQSERGGIGGGVSLKITRHARIADWFISFESGKIHWHAELANAIGKTLRWSIKDRETILGSGDWICHSNRIEQFSDKVMPQLWSDRNPVLYTAELELLDGETLLDYDSRQWGARTVRCEGNSILVNGLKTYFRGVTEHCYFAETCNPHFDKEKYLHDLGVLKAAGFNFIRCHTWCPPEPFYDACDELGFLIQTELPSVYTFAEAEAIIRLIRKHPCAVILCEGNEKILDESALERLHKLVDMLHTQAPGILFNPQEAMRGIEYGFSPDQKIVTDPFPYDPDRMKIVGKMADVYGALFCGHFSYSHDAFPGVETIEAIQKVYSKPCLSHEIGILGGYLDFSLEKRYEGTFIGTDLFRAARENMSKHGVYQNARLYYERNCRFISSIRKQLFENIRSCPDIAGFDFLGGIDTHWHLIGYPCGILNEFYEEKYGETVADVRRYNDETVLLCGAGNKRNRKAGTVFSEKILISNYSSTDLQSGSLAWGFEMEDGTVVASGEIPTGSVKQGTVTELGTVIFDLPNWDQSHTCILRTSFSNHRMTVENHWNFWIFPTVEDRIPNGVRCEKSLSDETIQFMADGGAVLLTGGFPGESMPEHFRPHSSGRSIGHSGGIPHKHPVWKKFPEDGIIDWQFFPMMTDSMSLITDPEMPEYQPILELIPSFKLIKRKSLLSEFKVGKGRLMVCGFRLDQEDPAANWMKHVILNYLARHDYADAPEWPPDKLRLRLNWKTKTAAEALLGKKIDAGGRPVD
ncbi:MAG: hypothetical protein J5858_12065 [Lentisphaeria bacterium]|nr:hypothetical protein [Lentisphaeria bacterium]